jgi:hypothetical protein
MPSTRLIAVFAVACINLNVAIHTYIHTYSLSLLSIGLAPASNGYWFAPVSVVSSWLASPPGLARRV